MGIRKILLRGTVVTVVRDGDELVAPDGRCLEDGEAQHLPPCEPTKIIAVHLNYRSRLEGYLRTPDPAPTYIHKPVSSLNAHGGAVVRPERCEYLSYVDRVSEIDPVAARRSVERWFSSPSMAERYRPLREDPKLRSRRGCIGKGARA